METEDAAFTANNGNAERTTADAVSELLLRRITDTLSMNYGWIKFVAVIFVIFAVTDLILCIIGDPLDILGIAAAILYLLSASYLVKGYRTIRKAYEYCSQQATEQALTFIGKYFMFHAIAIVIDLVN